MDSTHHRLNSLWSGVLLRVHIHIYVYGHCLPPDSSVRDGGE